MKNNIYKNVNLDKGEKVFKDFRKLNAKGYSCQIMLTTKRLIVYSHGLFMSRGKRAKQKRMNEISLNSIHRMEHYIEYLKNNIWVRIIGFLLFVGAGALGYLLYMGRIPVPASIPFQPYIKYITAGALALIALFMMFTVRKTLYFTINSGANEKTTIKLDVSKYNETAVKYISSKVKTI